MNRPYWGRSQDRPSRIQTRSATWLGVAGLVFFVGCGETNSKPREQSETIARKATPSTAASHTAAVGSNSPPQTHIAPVERIEVSSPVMPGRVIPTQYTCYGRDVPPPLRWRGIPRHTAELLLEIIKVRSASEKLEFSWAVAHIDPRSHGISIGKPPAGTAVGLNEDGRTEYRLCPPKNQTEPYVVVLFALPHRLAARSGFDPAALRRQAEHTATYQSLYVFQYKPR